MPDLTITLEIDVPAKGEVVDYAHEHTVPENEKVEFFEESFLLG